MQCHRLLYPVGLLLNGGKTSHLFGAKIISSDSNPRW
jgi:hypothetical protein